MSFPWPSDLHRRNQSAVTAMPGKRLHFESLESRILLSAEIGIPPNDLFADELSKDRFSGFESRQQHESESAAVTLSEALRSSIVNQPDRFEAAANEILTDVPQSWVLPVPEQQQQRLPAHLHDLQTGDDGWLFDRQYTRFIAAELRDDLDLADGFEFWQTPAPAEVTSSAEQDSATDAATKQYGRADFVSGTPDLKADPGASASNEDLPAAYGSADFISGVPDLKVDPAVSGTNENLPGPYGRSDYVPAVPNTKLGKSLDGFDGGVISLALIAPPQQDGTVVGTTDDDTFRNSASDSTFQGLVGDDIYLFDDGWGSDLIDELAAEGIDTLDFSAVRADLTFNINADGSINVTDGVNDVFVAGNVENLIGGRGDDVFIFEDGAVLSGTLSGGGGSDTLDYSTDMTGILADLAAGNATGTAGVTRVENVSGGLGNDTITGDAGDNFISGGAGDDVLDGGAGNDTIGYATAAAGVTVDLSDITQQTTGGGGDDTLAGFENIIGTDFDDVLTGTAADNIIAGGAGDDVLDGGAGNDTVSYATATAAVTVDLSDLAQQMTGGGGDDTLTGFENIIGSGYGIGDGFGDTLTGTAGDNRFYVAAGADASIDGGLGNDSLVVDGRNLALTGTTATTLDFASTPATTVTHNGIENLQIDNSSTDLSNNDLGQLSLGLQALADRLQELEVIGAYASAIPLADPLGATFGDLQNFGRVMQEMVDAFNANFGEDPDGDGIFVFNDPLNTSTTGAVSAFLAAWIEDDLQAQVANTPEDIRGTLSWIAQTLSVSQQMILDGNGDVVEVRFAQQIASDRSSAMDLSLSGTLRDESVAVERETLIDFLSGFQLDFNFGLTGLTGTSEFVLDRALQLSSSADLISGQPVALAADALIGFMDGSIDGSLTELSATADTELTDSPDADGSWTLSELRDETLDPFDITMETGIVDAALEFFTGDGFAAGLETLGDGFIDLGSANFLTEELVVTLPGSSGEFTLISPNELLGMLDQFGGWLSGLAQSELLDLNLPFAGSTTIGDLLDYGEAFGDELLRFLVHHDGFRLTGDLQNGGVTPAGVDVSFNIVVETATGIPQTYDVTLDAGSLTADGLRQAIETAVVGVIDDTAISDEIEVFLEGERIGFRPIANASNVSGIALPMIGNESLGFDGERFVVPTSVLDNGVLGHDLEFTVNAGDGTEFERTISVVRDPDNTSFADLITDINTALNAEFTGVSVALDAGSTRELAFSVADDAILNSSGEAVGAVVLIDVIEPVSLIEGLFSLGVETAGFASAQELADRLTENLPGDFTVNFDVANAEMSFTVVLERTFDIASLPIDLSLDLGDFVDIESASTLGVNADVALAFTFGVDLEPTQSLIVAPPIAVPQLSDVGQLLADANFNFTLLQQNFDLSERLSGGSLAVGDWSVTASETGGVAAAVSWSAPASGQVVDAGTGERLADHHFFIAVTDDNGVESFIDGVLLSFDTEDNTGIAKPADPELTTTSLAGDLELAMTNALTASGFSGLQITISNASETGFDISASGTGFAGYQLRLVTADEFAIAADTAVSVRSVDTADNQSVPDLIEDVQDAIDNATASLNLEQVNDTLLGLSEASGQIIEGSPLIGDVAVPENGVLDRDVRFEVTIGGMVYRGVVTASSTIDNEQENEAQPDPLEALAADVAAAINDAIAGSGSQVTVTAQPSLQSLEYGVIGTAIGELHFVTPAVVAEFSGNRVGLYAVPVLVQPVDGAAGKLLGRRIDISTEFNDPAFTELGLLSSPIPGDGVLGSTAEFVVVVDDTRYPITVDPDTGNTGVDDLIDDINVQLEAVIGNVNGDPALDPLVQVRRVMFSDTVSSGGNRIEFFTANDSGIQSLVLPAIAPPAAGDPANAAIDQLGFSTTDDHSARIQSGEFFIRDASLAGGLSLDASDIEASVIVGFGGEGGLGVGAEVVDSMGSVFGDVSISLVNPDAMVDPADATRLSLDTLWDHLVSSDRPIADIVDAELSGGVDIDLNVAPVLPIRTPIEPANIAIDLELADWLNEPPSLDDASLENGLSVNVSGLDLNIYDALSNLTFSDVVDALQEVLSFLRELQGQGDDGNGALAEVLDRPLPLLNQSPTELLVVADQFAALVDEVIANPAGSLSQLESMLEDLLGLPEELVTLGLDFDDGLALRIDLVFQAGIEESLGFDLDLEDLVSLTAADSVARDLLQGVTGLVGVSSTGDLSVGVDGTVRLSFGIALGNGNGSAEALGFRDGATSTGGVLTASGDAQAAADRLVDQDIEFELLVDGQVFLITVTASEQTSDPVEVDLTTRLSELENAPELRIGDDISITLLDGTSLDIDLNPLLADPTIAEVVLAINDASPDLTAVFSDELQRIVIEDSSTAGANTQQSGVFVTRTGVIESAALQFSLQVGNGQAVPVSVAAMTDVTRKQWLAAIDEAIRKAMVDAGQLNPVADAVVDVAYNGVIEQLTFQGTGDGFGERLTIFNGGVFSIADITDDANDNSSDLAKLFGLAGADDDGDRIISGKILRTDAPADVAGLEADVQRAIDAATGDPSLVTVSLLPPESGSGAGRLEFTADAASELIIRSVTQPLAPFLYNGADGTAFIVNAGAAGENLEFTAQVGPFGFFVIDGSANLDAFFNITLEDTGALDGRTFFGQDEFAIDTEYGGSVVAELPLFFPTESTPVNETDNTLDIAIPDLLAFLGSENSGGTDRTEGSVIIESPDLTAFPTPTLIGMLSNPEFIIDGLDSILLSIQDALDGEVYGIDLPLIGDGLAPAGQFIADFREDVLAYLSLKLREGGLNPVTLVQETLYNIFGGEDDGDPAALAVIGFAPDDGTGTLQAGSALTSGALERNAELNITVGNGDTTRVVVFAEDIVDDTSEALIEAINNSLKGRGLDEQLTAGFEADGNGGFFVTFTATDPDDVILIETAGAIQLDLFGLSVGALDLMQDVSGLEGMTDDLVDINDIVKSGFGLFDEFGQFDFLLGDSTVFGQSLDFDLGLPLLNFDLDAGVELKLDWQLAFGFGVSQEDGFYFVAGDDGIAETPDLIPNAPEELIIDVEVNLLGVLGFSHGRASVPDADLDLSVATATAELPADGRLSGDIVFDMDIDGELLENIMVSANDTNASADDLVMQIEAAIDAALIDEGLAPELVTARMELDADGEATGRLQLVTGIDSTVIIYNSATAMGQLGFLVVEAIDGGRVTDTSTPPAGREHSGLTLRLAVDVMDPGSGSSADGRLTFSEISSSSTQLSDIVSASAEGNAMVDLGLTVSFDSLGLDSSFLPAIGTDLNIDWTVGFNTLTGVEIESPMVFFDDITLDLGSFISDFAGPFLADIGGFLEPLGFLLDRQDGLLYKRLPVISDLAGETVTLKQLAETLDRNGKIVPFLNAIEEIFFLTGLVSDAATEASNNGGSILLEFGDIMLDLAELEREGKTLAEATPNLDMLNNDATEQFNRRGDDPGTESTRSFTKTVTKPGGGSISFDILQPGTIVDLLLGKPDVNLITYDLPPFGFNFEYLQRFPVFPPLFATLRGYFSASIDLGFGYDTLGLNQFLASENPLDLINGFFLNDVDASGFDIPEVTLIGGIAAGASLDAAVASAGVEGGIDATILFNLNDPDQDTKVRLSEMLGNILINNFNPIAVFDASGKIDAFLRAYVEVLFGLWSKDYELARVTLASFDIPFQRTPILAQDIGNGVLQLNMGPASVNRIHGSLADNSESIAVRFDSGSVYVSDGNGGREQRFIGVEQIVVDAGAGDDRIDLRGLAGSNINVEVHGGTGDDRIIGASGGQTIVFGGAGNDRIDLREAPVSGSDFQLNGGTGNDIIYGAMSSKNIIFGNEGDDTITGGSVEDEIEGGDGNDTLEGGGGNDIYRFSGNWGDDEVVENTSIAGGDADIWDFAGTSTDINFALGADVRVGVVENAVVQGNLLRITSTRHGLSSGDQVDLSGILGALDSDGNPMELPANAIVNVDAADPDSFTVSLTEVPASFVYQQDTGIFQLDRSALTVDEFRNADESGDEMLIQVETDLRHGLQDGDIVSIGQIDPLTGEATLEGQQFTVTVVDGRTFNLDGTDFTNPAFDLENAFVQRQESGTGLVEGVGIGAGVVTITSANHGLGMDDEIALFGSTIDGLDPALDVPLNNAFTVTIVDENTFTIDVGVAATDLLAGLAPGALDTTTAVWQLNSTTATSVGNSVFLNGYGIETIAGGRGGDVFDVYQTAAQQVVLDGAGGSDTYRAFAIESRIGLGANANTRLFDTGDLWDTDVALFFGSESGDRLAVDNTNITTVLGADAADARNPRFSYGEPNIVLGFQSGSSADGELIAETALDSGVLDRPARLLLGIDDNRPVLIVVEPDDVGGNRTVDDLLIALNEAIANSDLNGTVRASSTLDADGRQVVTFVAAGPVDPLDPPVTISIENVSQGSGIEALEVEALGGDDTIVVSSTNGRTSVRVSGGLGDDSIAVGGPADLNTDLITVDGIRGSSLTGSLVIEGNEGFNSLFVSDAEDVQDNSGSLTDSVLSGLGMQINIEYSDIAALSVQLGSGSDTFAIESTIEGETTVLAGDGADTVDIETVAGILNVDGEAGADAITLQSSGAGSTSNISGGTEADGIDIRTMQGNVNVQAGDGDDDIEVGSMAGLNQPGTVNLINGQLDISGGAGNDTLSIDDTQDGGLVLAAPSVLSSLSAESGRLSGDALFGLDFGDGEVVEINVAADIGNLPAASAIATSVQADGRLSSDAMFILTVGSEKFEVTVQRDTGNQSLDDLLDDLNTALEAVGIDATRLTARLDGDVIVFDSLQGEDVRLQLEVGDTAATELGFADDTNAVFGNNSSADLEADINAAFADAGVADRVSAAIDPATNSLSLSLLSGDFMLLALEAGNPANTDLGLTGGQLIQPNNVGTLRVNETTGRAELVGLGMGVPGDGLPGIVYDTIASVNISLGSGHDQFNVQGTLNDEAPAIQSLTTIDTGDGDDVINVSSNGPSVDADRGHLTGVLDAVQGELSLFAGNGHNILNVSDRDSTVGDTGVTITRNSIVGLAPAAINYSAGSGFAGGVNIWAGRADDTVRIESTLADDVTTLHANDGNDRITITDVDTAIDDGLLVVEAGLGNDFVDGSLWNTSMFVFGDLGEVEYQDRTRAFDQIVNAASIQIDSGGADEVFGGSANDLLIGGTDADSMSGGQGDDAVIGDGGMVTFGNGEVLQVEATDFFIGGGDLLAGGAMNVNSQTGGDGNDVIIGGAGFDILFGTLAEDILIYEYGRVTYENDLATTVIVLGQRPLDLAASEMFDLYLKDRFLVPPYFVGEVAADRSPIQVDIIAVSTGSTSYSNAYHQAQCKKYLAEVGFELNSAVLTAESHEYLRQAAQFLSDLGGVIVQIGGHADSTGASDLNQRLSLDRAESVVEMLVEYGVNPAIVRAYGYGEERPVGDNATAEGRAQNRRVEVEIDGGVGCKAPDSTQVDGATGMGLLALAGWRSAQMTKQEQNTRRINW